MLSSLDVWGWPSMLAMRVVYALKDGDRGQQLQVCVCLCMCMPDKLRTNVYVQYAAWCVLRIALYIPHVYTFHAILE